VGGVQGIVDAQNVLVSRQLPPGKVGGGRGAGPSGRAERVGEDTVTATAATNATSTPTTTGGVPGSAVLLLRWTMGPHCFALRRPACYHCRPAAA